MPKYIIQNGKAIRADKIPEPKKVEPKEQKVQKEVEGKAFDEEKYLNEYTVKELKEIAEKYKIETEGKTKKELIEEIKEKVGG